MRRQPPSRSTDGYTFRPGLRFHWGRLLFLIVVLCALFAVGSPARGLAKNPFRKDQNPATPQAPAVSPIIGEATPISSAPETAVRDAISRANQAFRVARAQADDSALAEVGTGSWLEYERAQVAQLRSQGARQQWAATRVHITGQKINGDRATACTEEDWSRVEIRADGTQSPPETLQYVEHYTFTLQNGAWLVEAIDYPSGSAACAAKL